jgi:hypothetical protein
VKWIVCSDQAFTEIENNNFRNILRLLNHDALPPTADTIKNDIMETFSVERNNIRQILQV